MILSETVVLSIAKAMAIGVLITVVRVRLIMQCFVVTPGNTWVLEFATVSLIVGFVRSVIKGLLVVLFQEVVPHLLLFHFVVILVIIRI